MSIEIISELFVQILLHPSLFLPGFADVNDITQSPNIMLPLKENATLTCSHTKDSTYNQMYWFIQHQGKTMELIVYATSFGTVEFGKLNKEKYSVNYNSAEKGFLTVINLETHDSALYLCAVSEHSAAESLHRCTKTVTRSDIEDHTDRWHSSTTSQYSLIEGLRS